MLPALQREEPADATRPTSGQRYQADNQTGSQCRHECQQCMEQLTTVLLLRARGPRTTVRLWPDGLESTHRSRPRVSQRATGLSWNLTFADATEKVRDGESGRSRVAIANLG